MASIERRHGSGNSATGTGTSSDEEVCIYKRNIEDDSKTKKKSKRNQLKSFNFNFKPSLQQLVSDFQLDPKRTTKKVLFKLFFYIWCITVVLSILNLLGFRILPSRANKLQPKHTSVVSQRRQLDTNEVIDADAEFDVDAIADATGTSSGSESSLWSSVIGDILSLSDDASESEEKAAGEGEQDKDEDIPIQMLPAAVKEGNKLNKKLERELACVELTCIDDCNKKIKPKCAKSKTCRNDRDKICKRRCRKARCEERCKDEPKFGYVEREQRMDKCKEECTGPTAAHNKCIKKCHSQFKPCKSRCHEIAGKYPCDNPPVTQPPEEIEDEPESSSATADLSSSISSKAQELIEDPEMI